MYILNFKYFEYNVLCRAIHDSDIDILQDVTNSHLAAPKSVSSTAVMNLAISSQLRYVPNIN